jgi:hypothetical protein
MRQRLGRLLLAAALVLAQYGVNAHALSHLDEALYGDGFDHAAEICVAFDAVSGGAAPSSELAIGGVPAPDGVVALAPSDPLLPPLALTRFASRAPPAIS